MTYPPTANFVAYRQKVGFAMSTFTYGQRLAVLYGIWRARPFELDGLAPLVGFDSGLVGAYRTFSGGYIFRECFSTNLSRSNR
jgi:hypothetical protein